MAGPEPLSQEWREAHCRAGDRALRVAEAFAEGRPTRTTRDNFDERSAAVVAGYATIAQAHYAAANVRAKLAPAAAPETDYPTALESPHG